MDGKQNDDDDDMVFHEGRILGRSLISPTVMRLDLEVLSLNAFLPGQWVDFVAKPNRWVGGFSIASSPRDLPNLTLAIKESSKDLPAKWVHEESRVGDSVEIRVGGDSCLEDTEERPSVFCAGGIGISPILSQYREFLVRRSNPTTAPTRFLYSASNPKEFVFWNELADLSLPNRCHDTMVFAVTGRAANSGDWGKDFPPHVETRNGRILLEFLDSSPREANYYICGPPSMIDDAVQHLTNNDIPDERIKYEKWW